MNNNNNLYANTQESHGSYDESVRTAMSAISFILSGGLEGRPGNINVNSGGSRRAAQFKQVYYNVKADTSIYPADFKVNFMLRSNSLSIFPNVVMGFPTQVSTVVNMNTSNNVAPFPISTQFAASAYFVNGTTGVVNSFFGFANPASLNIPFTENVAGVFVDSLLGGSGYESSFDITSYYDKGFVLTSNSKLTELVIQAGLSGFKGESVFGLLEQYPPPTNLTKTRLGGGTLNATTQFENFKADASIGIVQLGNCNMRYLANGSCNALYKTHLVKRTNLTNYAGVNLNYMDCTSATCSGLPLIEAVSSGLYFVDSTIQVGLSFEFFTLIANVAINFYLWADFGYYDVEAGEAVLKFVTVCLDTRTITTLSGQAYGVKMGGSCLLANGVFSSVRTGPTHLHTISLP